MRIVSCSFLVIAFGSFAGCGGGDALGLDPPPSDSPSTSGLGPTATQPSLTESPTTPALVPTGPGTQNTTDCARLAVQDPAVSVDGIKLFQPDEKRGNPQAGDPSYVYLAAGREGVILTGPSVASAADLFTLQSPSISMVGVRSTSADGYDVIVNPALKYQVAIDDFEFEVALARVELCEQDGYIQSWFVFRANAQASGVAHRITVTASANSSPSVPTTPVTVEVR